jgi:DNA-binding NtrC family response regulator
MSETIQVAIIDDEEDMRLSISQFMSLSGFDPVAYDGAQSALAAITQDYEGVIVSDIRMPGMDGMELLRRLHAMDAGLPVIMITGHGDVQMAVEAMRVGAFDFIEKPFDPDRLADLVRRAGHTRRLTLDNRTLRRELADGTVLLKKLIGTSPIMVRLREDILDLAQADNPVLIKGETGTGKSIVAHALHACGPKQGKPFITIDCAGLSDEELSARLFGGQAADDDAVFRQGRGGTVCLENVDGLSQPMQQALMAALTKQEETAVNDQPAFRVISTVSTAENEPDPMQANLIPELFFRLSGLQMLVPPLRDRGEDILTLFNRYAQRFAEEYGCETPELSAADAAILLRANWPGNVRQIINLAERIVLQNRRGAEEVSSLLNQATGEDKEDTQNDRPLKEHVEAFEKMLIENALRRHRGSIASVMDELSLPRRTLNEKMAKYALSRGEFT